MKCKCGYEGWAELGIFPNDRLEGKYKDQTLNFRCPQCKTNKNTLYLTEPDGFRIDLYFGREHGIMLSVAGRGVLAPDLVFYSKMYSGGMGSSGTISYENYGAIRKEALEKFGIPLKDLQPPSKEQVEESKRWWNSV